MTKKTKVIKSPAPATKPVATAKPAAKSKVAPATAPVLKTPVAKPVVKTVKAAKPAAAKVPTKPPVVPKPVPAKPIVTTITALIDIGFSHALFIRGEGPGLSWDQGAAMESVSDDKWQITLAKSARPVIFKFLVDDLSWNVGDDYTIAPGTSLTLTPVF